jgi:hypothetical protein
MVSTKLLTIIFKQGCHRNEDIMPEQMVNLPKVNLKKGQLAQTINHSLLALLCLG